MLKSSTIMKFLGGLIALLLILWLLIKADIAYTTDKAEHRDTPAPEVAP